MTNDSKELEDLFDSVAQSVQRQSSDNKDLENLFDTVAASTNVEQEKINESPSDSMTLEEKRTRVFNKVGTMVRTLHNTLGDLKTNSTKVEKILEKAVSGSLPDAQDRLAYIANLTEQAANRVLNATDVINPLVEDMGETSRVLASKWDKVFNNELSTEEFKQLALETREFLKSGMQHKLATTHNQVTEIMMAQDFQDLTGQVIKKVVVLTKELEQGLMSVLVDVTPEEMKNEKLKMLDDKLNGPVVNPEGRNDVAVNQKDVDDLLGSLGF